MTDRELLNHQDLHELSREQLIRRGWLLQEQEERAKGNRRQADLAHIIADRYRAPLKA